MTAPTAPRGERAGTPGAGWETDLRWFEVVVDEDDGDPLGWVDPPNRATRRAIAKAARRRNR